MLYLKYCFIVSLLILPNLMFSLPTGQVLSEERYFDWDESTSAWVTTERHDYELDSLGMIIRKVEYDGSGSVIQIWNCSYTDTSYALSNYSSWHSSDWKQSWTLTKTYTYDLNNKLLHYYYDFDYMDPYGGGYQDIYRDYTYSDDRIAEILETQMGDYYSTIKTSFTYNTEGYLLSEIDQSFISSTWVNKERTLWTWDGNSGTGVNEIYKNTVWIHQALKERTVDTNLKTTSEYRDYWSWGFWINDELDRDYYNTSGNITTIYTDRYNSTTSLHENDKLHAFYYEDFAGELTAPINITTSYSGSSITILWDAVDGAAGYKVYSSTDPYGEFTVDTSGTFNGTEWTAPVSENKKFYQVTAINGEE